MYKFLYILYLLIGFAYGISRQCFTCRSRGELGDCRDPFLFNSSTVNKESGVRLVPCPSGWCGKTIEGIRGPPDDFGRATERSCLSQGPPDGEERCAELRINNKPSQLCVCKGTLCNSSPPTKTTQPFLLILALIYILNTLIYTSS